MKTIPSWARHYYKGTVSVFLIMLIMATLIVGMAGCSNRPAVDAIEIRDWYDLAAISDNMTADYILINNLDTTTDGWEELASPTANDGKGWDPIGGYAPPWFNGVFDGQEHEIRGLFINRPDEMYVGLFGMLAMAGIIRNVGVVDADVTGGAEYVGGLVGHLSLGYVSNSYFIGTVTGSTQVGGLVGTIANKSSVNNSYAIGTVTGSKSVGGLAGDNYESTVGDSYSTGIVTGHEDVGGLIGMNDGDVINSYSSGNVTGSINVGGLVGWNYRGAISNSYSTGNVTPNGYRGGLVGRNKSGGIVSDSFWDTETSGQATSDGGTGKNTTEMQDITTFTDVETVGLDEPWDIFAVANLSTRNTDHVWNIVDEETYPFLNWQAVS